MVKIYNLFICVYANIGKYLFMCERVYNGIKKILQLTVAKTTGYILILLLKDYFYFY